MPMRKLMLVTILLGGCREGGDKNAAVADTAAGTGKDSVISKYVSQPLVSHIYTADPSAHLFNGRIYIYPSHDTATGTPENDNGDHFNMMDYHILTMDSIGGTVTDNGVAFPIGEIPWAG